MQVNEIRNLQQLQHFQPDCLLQSRQQSQTHRGSVSRVSGSTVSVTVCVIKGWKQDSYLKRILLRYARIPRTCLFDHSNVFQLRTGIRSKILWGRRTRRRTRSTRQVLGTQTPMIQEALGGFVVDRRRPTGDSGIHWQTFQNTQQIVLNDHKNNKECPTDDRQNIPGGAENITACTVCYTGLQRQQRQTCLTAHTIKIFQNK